MLTFIRKGRIWVSGGGLLVVVYALLLGVADLSAPPIAAHAPAAADTWTGSRARCVICHSHSGHQVTMPHVIGPTCGTCHSGSSSRVGCPSCHSIHTVDVPHITYPTCATCHSEPVAAAPLSDTATGYMAYLFGQPSGVLRIEDTTSKAGRE